MSLNTIQCFFCSFCPEDISLGMLAELRLLFIGVLQVRGIRVRLLWVESSGSGVRSLLEAPHWSSSILSLWQGWDWFWRLGGRPPCRGSLPVFFISILGYWFCAAFSVHVHTFLVLVGDCVSCSFVRSLQGSSPGSVFTASGFRIWVWRLFLHSLSSGLVSVVMVFGILVRFRTSFQWSSLRLELFRVWLLCL